MPSKTKTLELSPQKTENKDNKENLPIKTGVPLDSQTLFKSPYYSVSYDFPYNPDPLCSGNNYDKYDEMRTDDQVKAVLTIKKDFVISTGWEIKTDNEEIKEFITDNLENLNYNGLDSSFNDILREILTSYDYGFSLSEPIFEIKDSKYIYKSIVVRPPHSFQFNLDSKGNTTSITQLTEKGVLSFSPDIFLHHVNEKEFSNPYGTSSLRAAYQPYKAKKFIERMYARYIEKFASPTIVGKYPRNFENSEIDEFFNNLNKVQNCTTLTIPEGTEIEFKETNGQGGDLFVNAINHYNTMIARSVLIPDLMGLSGGEIKGGAFALGQEHYKLFLETIKKDRLSLAKKITLKLIKPLVKLNFGDIPCTFEFKPFEREKELLDIWTKAVSSKVFTPNDDEVNYFRSSLGFPVGDVEIPAPLPIPSFNPNDKMNGNDKPDEKVKEHSHNYKFKRALSQYEKKIDFALVQETLIDKADKFLPKLVSTAKDISNNLVEQLKEEVLQKRYNPDKINQIQPKFLKPMNIVLRQYFTDLFKNSTNQAQKELFPEKENIYTEALLPEEFLELLQSESFKVVGDYSGEITKKAKNLLTQGLKNGLAQSEIIKAIKEEMGITTERWLNTMLRTKTTEIFNEARKRYWETDEYAKQLVVAYQWSSVLDDRTSAICEELDQEILDIETSQKLKPPAHYNCRSLLVPITKFEDYQLSNLPSKTNLEDLGGNLLMFARILQISGILKSAGDNIIIRNDNSKKQIEIVSIDITNFSTSYPVQIDIKDSISDEIVYQTMLDKNGGRVFRKFESGMKVIEKGSGLIVNLSANVDVSYLIEYRLI